MTLSGKTSLIRIRLLFAERVTFYVCACQVHCASNLTPNSKITHLHFKVLPLMSHPDGSMFIIFKQENGAIAPEKFNRPR